MAQKYNFIHERGDYPPLAVEEIGVGWTSSIKKTVSDADSPVFMIYKNGWTRIFGYQEQHQKIVNYVFNKISKDKKCAVKIKKFFEQKAPKFLSFAKKIKKLNWSKLSNQQIVKIKQKYAKLYNDIVPYGEPLPYFLKEKLQIVLDEYLIKEKNIPVKEYEILITPLYQSFLNQESQELWNLAKKYKNNLSKFKKAIKKHQEKYAWLLFDYASLVADENYFLKKARGFIKEPPKFLDYKKLETRKQQIIKNYKIAPFYVYYLDLLEELFYLMDRKKEVLTQGHFAINFLFREVAKRLGFDLNIIRWFFWKEVKEALLGKKRLNPKIAYQRKKSSVLKYTNGKPIFLTLKEAKKLILDIKKDQQFGAKQRTIKGISASAGKVKGKICYLKSARENHKIKKGQVLLVSNTTPDFMPAVHKAIAIVTNEGGLTCHAAIVSREFKIPCVVGTKIATQVFKDGDLVEVDANKGIVKILKKA